MSVGLNRRPDGWGCDVRIRVGVEELLFDGKPLYQFFASTGKAHIYRDDHASARNYGGLEVV